MTKIPGEARLRLQNEQTMRDLPSRLVSIPFALLLSLHFLPAVFVAMLLAVILTIEALGVIVVRRIARRATLLDLIFLGILTFAGASVFALLPVMLWSTSQPTAMIMGFAIIVTGLLHTIMVRTTYIAFGLLTAVPLIVALVVSVVGFLLKQEDQLDTLIGGAMMATMIAYTMQGFLTINRTRSGLLEASERAEAESRAKSRFIAVMSHEIRTPLNAILGMAQVLEAEASERVEQERARLLVTSSFSLKAIVDDVLDHAKVEAGRVSLDPSPTAIPEDARSVVELHRSVAEAKGLRLDFVVASELPERLSVDALRMRQVLGNLVSNAIKYTDTGRVTVTLSGSRSGFETWILRFAVEDTGPGISKEAAGELFEDFVQLAPADRSRSGTGLGLAIARGLAQLMGGDVRVISEPGEGSTFTYSFQATTAQASAQRELGAPARDRLEGRLLIVDDLPSNRFVVRSLLRGHGLEVVDAADGVEAMARLGEGAFDAVLLDMHMPRMDGTETLAAMAAAGGRIAATPVILMTADALAGTPAGGQVAGYIPKPVDRRDLVTALESVIVAQKSAA